MLTCENLYKRFQAKGSECQAVLDGVSYEFERGQKYLLLGPSGSGKTTLLSIVGCMLSPCEGVVSLAGQQVDFREKRELCRIRRRWIGFVFQHAQLMPFLTVQENLLAVCRNFGMSRTESHVRTDEVLTELGLAHLKRHRPPQCSGGERQRVAIARAIVHRPSVILADEPTASLDWTNGQRVVELLNRVVAHSNAVLITVTHDTRLIPHFDRCLKLEEGKVVERR